MTDIIYRKLRGLIDKCEQMDYQNEVNRARLQAELSSKFRLTNSEMGQIISEMMERDIIEKENRLKIRIRR
jgi:hypothetical protein